MIDPARLPAALQDPALPSIERGELDSAAGPAAYELAVALGLCRVFGGGHEDERLPPAVALAAAKQLLAECQVAANDVAELASQGASHTIEANHLALDVLDERTELFAAFVAIDEAYAAEIEARGMHKVMLTTAMDRMLTDLERLDEAMQAQWPALKAALATTSLRANWLACLAEEYRELPPWWMVEGK